MNSFTKTIKDVSEDQRKKIENYILIAYFSKRVESWAGGRDFIRGTFDIPDLLVEVELFANNVAVIKWLPYELLGKVSKMEMFCLGPVAIEEV